MEDSKYLRLMKDIKKGYRTKDFRDQEIKSLYEVVLFEFKEKENMDILIQITERYRFGLWEAAKKSFETDGQDFNAYCTNRASNSLRKGMELSLYDIVEDFLQERAEMFAKEVCSFIEAKSEKRNLKGVWITTKMAMEDEFNDEKEDIHSYGLSDSDIVLSDLGQNGVLFAIEVLNKIRE